jgi:hypothetical protein
LLKEELPSKNPLAIIVMVGNSLASPHVEMMIKKSKINALLASYYYYMVSVNAPLLKVLAML